MLEDERWRRLLKPGITAIVGAGGKTTVLERLGVYGQMGNFPIVVSSTVPVEGDQIQQVDPFAIICTDDLAEGEAFCVSCINGGRVPAWFSKIDSTGRYLGVSETTINTLKAHHPEWYIVLEADATHNKWLKAPGAGTVLIPTNSDTIIFVLNLQMLGHALTEDKVEGIEEVAAIMERPVGAVTTPGLLAKLIRRFDQVCTPLSKRRILFCTGYDAVQHRMTEALLDDLDDLDLAAIILADGYRETCMIRQHLRV